jgi:hypothetical protein
LQVRGGLLTLAAFAPVRQPLFDHRDVHQLRLCYPIMPCRRFDYDAIRPMQVSPRPDDGSDAQYSVDVELTKGVRRLLVLRL